MKSPSVSMPATFAKTAPRGPSTDPRSSPGRASNNAVRSSAEFVTAATSTTMSAGSVMSTAPSLSNSTVSPESPGSSNAKNVRRSPSTSEPAATAGTVRGIRNPPRAWVWATAVLIPIRDTDIDAVLPSAATNTPAAVRPAIALKKRVDNAATIRSEISSAVVVSSKNTATASRPMSNVDPTRTKTSSTAVRLPSASSRETSSRSPSANSAPVGEMTSAN